MVKTWNIVEEEKEKNDSFGFSISLNKDGTVLAVGSPTFGTNNHGKISIYELCHNQWQKRNTYEGENDEDYFGFTTSLNGDGNVLAVGAPGKVSVGVNPYIKIYEVIGNNLINETKLTAIGGAGNLNLGWSVSLSNSGKQLVSSNVLNTEIRLYQNEGNWIEKSNYIIPGVSTNKNAAVTMDNNNYRVAGIFGSSGTIPHVGVFDYTDSQGWQQIPFDDGNFVDGTLVSFSQDMIYLALNINSNIKIYNYYDGSFNLQKTLNGDSMSLNSDGSIIVIGNSTNNIVKMYERNNDNWVQKGDDINSIGTYLNVNSLDRDSIILSKDGNTVAIGGPVNGDGVVKVYSFKIDKIIDYYCPNIKTLKNNTLIPHYSNNTKIMRNSRLIKLTSNSSGRWKTMTIKEYNEYNCKKEDNDVSEDNCKKEYN
jgi:hypothetical protein